jgi:hypothetical protein
LLHVGQFEVGFVGDGFDGAERQPVSLRNARHGGGFHVHGAGGVADGQPLFG